MSLSRRQHRVRHRQAAGLIRWQCVLLMAVAASPLQAADASPEDLAFFESQVRPLLVQHCSECHSAAAGDPEGGLSFDTRADFFAAEGIATAGHPDESLLVDVVRYDGDLQMPPDGRLPDEAIATIEAWVRRGLPWPDDGSTAAATGFDIAARKAAHWCWTAPQVSPVPTVQDARWCRGEIDRFVLARLEGAGLSPAAEASREQLVRRAAEVLTGLPPDPADVAAVVADPDPHAFDRYVDRLLASPHYGERFARHWLDVVRFGETRGHEFDYPIPNAWQYRDWVVRAFNADLPYDRFVREQIAGDLVEQPRLSEGGIDESVIGTGFWLLGEEVHSPVDIRQDEADRMDNRVDTFGKAFLGMALGCARCHDHKFDAISADDYYAITGMVRSSSYRQVAFESIEANRHVIAGLAAKEVEAKPRLQAALAAVLGDDATGLWREPELRQPSDTADQTVLADFTRGDSSTPIVGDPAWELVREGDLRLVEMDGSDEAASIRLEPVGHARSDAIWATSQSTGERDAGPLGSVDRAGRVLRTPKQRISGGVLWHRVRGHLQIFAVVDSHVLLQGGPIYGSHLVTVDTKGEWQWVAQDMRKDLDWSDGHVVHVEYAAIAGEVAVAETVASLEQPARDQRTDLGAANERLAAVDWSNEEAASLLAEARRHADARAAILSHARLVSATAPALLDGNGIDCHVLLKGSAARPGDLAPRRFLEAIDGPQQPAWPGHSSGRLLMADRVLDPANPLTARVIVNRVWHHLFGRGLVPTTDNFGVLGEAAADPLAQALLDTLAVRFREEGWSIKQLVRQIVTSSTWRMSSSRDPAAVESDPLNRLLHHYPLRRLEGEAIRDSILAVSGRLDRTIGGPSVEVFIAPYHEGRGRPASGPLDGAGRRSLYTKVRRNFLPSFLVAFDMPVPFQARGRRNVTNVPAQALAMMNDPFVAEQATLWARKTLADTTLSPEQRIERMYREAFARSPAVDELSAAEAFLEVQTAAHGGVFADDPRQEAAWADLAHALLNAKEFIFVP